MIKLIKNYSSNPLSESFQSNAILFSFVNKVEDTHQQITTPAKCREYFNEFLMQNHHPDEFKWQTVYGFSYDYAKSPYDLSTTLLSMNFPTEDSVKMFLDNLEFLWQVEDYNKIPRTVITPTEDKQTFLVEGNAFWNQKCILLNIYTWILKLCSINFDIVIHKNASEVLYLTQVTNTTFNNLLNSLREIHDAPSKYVDGSDKLRTAGTVHAASGILSIKYIIRDASANWLSKHLYPLMEKIFNLKECSHTFLKTS